MNKVVYFYKRKIAPGFRLKKSAYVLDIGSGDKPFWRADVYVDDLSLGDIQRATESKTIHNIGHFVNASVEKLPFKNKEFDFTFCSHLLEHVNNPTKAINEIMRVSKSGYIEMPNGIIETVKPFVSHLWFVYLNGKKLIFVRKSIKMHKILFENGNNFFSTINKAPDPFIRLYWNKKIEFEVIDELKESEKYYPPKQFKVTQRNFNFYLYLIKVFRILFYKSKK